MELEEKSLDVIANKIGIILILNIIFNGPMFYVLLKPFNLLKLEGMVELPLSVFSNFLLYMILALFLLKVRMKDIYNNNKEREKKLGWRSRILLYICLLSVYVFLSMCINYPTGLYKKIDQTYGTIFSSNTTLIMLIMASFLEEIFFRGVLLEKLRKYGDLFAIITSAIIFGSLHGIRFMHATILGLITGFLYIVGGNIRWSILFHFLINFGFGGTFIEDILTTIFSGFTVVDDNFVFQSVIVLSGVLAMISFALWRKDNTLVDLGHEWNRKVIGQKIKQDKMKYKTFFSSPMIVIFFIWEVANIIYYLVV